MSRIIISDTSCLIALDNAKILEILKDLYGGIQVTKEVSEEFGELLPEWIKIISVRNKKRQTAFERRLDKGEASVITLALESDNALLIIDEAKGRNIAKFFGVDVIGTIGVLTLAYKKGLISDLLGTIFTLVDNGFRLSDAFLKQLIEKFGQ